MCPEVLVSNSKVTSGGSPSYTGDAVQIECLPQHHVINYNGAETVQNFTCLKGRVWDVEAFDCVGKFNSVVVELCECSRIHCWP